MPKVIQPRDVEAIKLLKVQGLSNRRIAKLVGVSHVTVGHIVRAAGLVHNESPQEELEDVPGLSGDYLWCDGCQAHVRMPCVACRARVYQAAQRLRTTD
jgi:hypothetical protein